MIGSAVFCKLLLFMTHSFSASLTWQMLLPVALAVILCLTVWLYWPGLGGIFLFDDLANLQVWGDLQAQTPFGRFLEFVFSNRSGPTGRPVSMASFWIDDFAWPSHPRSFEYTNLMLHLLNGALVFYVVYLSSFFRDDLKASQRWIMALFCMTLWLWHPLNNSTALYIIQRMTELSALFMLAGLICYLKLRPQCQIQAQKTYFWMTIGLGIFGLLAIFSKENGALLLTYVLVLEYTLFNAMPAASWHHRWRFIVLTLPTVFLMVLLFVKTFAQGVAKAYSQRDFDLFERLLSEARILCDYLYQILSPHMGGSGVFHDDYLPSRGLTEPFTTLPAVLTVFCLIGTALYVRKRYPVYSFAILWFFGGHWLESGFLPLELYFEHRNYLPNLGPLLAIAYFIVIDSAFLRRRVRFIVYGTAVALLVLFAGVTRYNAIVWGQPEIFSAITVREHPRSVRANQTAAQIAFIQHDLQQARFYIQQAWQANPQDGALLLELLQLDCEAQTLTSDFMAELERQLTKVHFSNAVVPTLEHLFVDSKKDKCPLFQGREYQHLINTLLQNPNFQTAYVQHALYYWLGRNYARQRLLSPAIEALDKAFQYKPVVKIPLQQAVWLSSAGLYDDALTYIDKAKRFNQTQSLLFQNIGRQEIRFYEQQIIKAQAALINVQ